MRLAGSEARYACSHCVHRPPPIAHRSPNTGRRWLLRRVLPSAAVARSSGTKTQVVGVRLKGSRCSGKRVPAARQQRSSTRLRRDTLFFSTLWELRGVSTSIGSQVECFFSSFLRALFPPMQGTHARCRRPTERACSSAARDAVRGQALGQERVRRRLECSAHTPFRNKLAFSPNTHRPPCCISGRAVKGSCALAISFRQKTSTP